MAAGNIKGITIEIGGNTVGLTKALSDVNRQTKAMQTELKQVERLLKLDPKNTELLTQKQKLLGDSVSQVKDKLEALKKAKDEAEKTGNIDKYPEQYRKLQREIVATEQSLKALEKATKATNQAFLNSASEGMKKFGDKATEIGKNTIGVTVGIGAAAGASIKMASDYQESLNKVDVAFKTNSNEVKEWAGTSLESFGVAKGTALDLASLFGDMGTSMGLSTGEASKMSTSLVGLAGDLASFKNIGIEQAQDALKGIFTGEGESLKSLGVVMQDSTLKAYAQANGFKKSYEQMTQAEKVNLRYAFVMDATKNAQGDFARTSDGTANSMRIFSETIKELGTQIGEKLLPIITPIIQKITEWVKWFGELDGKTQGIILIVLGIVAILPPLLILIGAMSTGIGILTGIFAGLTLTMGLWILAIAAVIAIGVLLYKNWDTIKAFFISMWDKIKEGIANIGEWFAKLPEKAMEMKDKVVQFFNELPGKIGYAIGLILGKIVQWGIDAVNWVKTEVPKFIVAYINFWLELPGKIWNAVLLIMGKLGEWAVKLIEWAKKEIPIFVGKVIEFFKELPTKIVQVGTDLVKGLWNGIIDSLSWIGGKIKDFCTGILQGFKDGLDEKSPSKATEEMGEFLVQGLEQGVENEKKSLIETIDVLAMNVLDRFNAIREKFAFNANNLGVVGMGGKLREAYSLAGSLGQFGYTQEQQNNWAQSYLASGGKGASTTSVTINQTITTTAATPSEVSQATNRGIKELELAGTL